MNGSSTPAAPWAPGSSDWAYAARVWLGGGLFAILTALVIVCTPGVRRRRHMARAAARRLLRIAGFKLSVAGLEHLPEGGCIVAANHASYLDGIVLTAALPPEFGFVIKREVTRVPLVSLLLRRLRSLFVDRFDARAGRADAGALIRRVQSGHAIGIFPEGTFIAEPGLRPFRRGAFVAACRADLPVVPIGIRGTRAILPAHRWLPRRGPIEVEVRPPVRPSGKTVGAAAELRDAVRAQVLAACGEPDLAPLGERDPDPA
jgi:1-acyl-sn-glycerol-3-phosphate acyltransferase